MSECECECECECVAARLPGMTIGYVSALKGAESSTFPFLLHLTLGLRYSLVYEEFISCLFAWFITYDHYKQVSITSRVSKLTRL